jgi:Domain of unknown function (DUF4169)
MGDIVNLNQFRKKKKEKAAKKKANQNRHIHGRSKIERQADKIQQEIDANKLQNKKLIKKPKADDGSNSEN